MRVKDIFIHRLTTINLNATMLDAQNIMQQNNFRHLPVSDGKELVGIISDRDIKLATVVGVDGDKDNGRIHSYKKVSDFMSTPVLKARHSDRIESVVRDMINFKVSCFVVVNDSGENVGILTTEDLLIVFLDVLTAKDSIFSKLQRLWRPS